MRGECSRCQDESKLCFFRDLVEKAGTQGLLHSVECYQTTNIKAKNVSERELLYFVFSAPLFLVDDLLPRSKQTKSLTKFLIKFK